MIPVDQTDITFESGNCFSAVVASLLEIDLTEVPTFFFASMDAKESWSNFNDWISERGFTAFELFTEQDGAWTPNQGQWCWLVGPSPRDAARKHSVVGRWNSGDYEVVHDPHPSKKGLPEFDTAGFLVPLNPVATRED